MSLKNSKDKETRETKRESVYMCASQRDKEKDMSMNILFQYR